MIIPTLDQTEGVWIERTSNQGYHYIQEIFYRDTPTDQAHRANCRMLIRRGSLQPESINQAMSAQREWDIMQRYARVHV
jgi:hypothetical protein